MENFLHADAGVGSFITESNAQGAMRQQRRIVVGTNVFARPATSTPQLRRQMQEHLFMGGAFDLPVAAVAYPAECLPPRSAFDAPVGAPVTPPAMHGEGVWAPLVRPIAHGVGMEANPARFEANRPILEAAAASSAPGSPYPNQSSGRQRQFARGNRKTGTWSTEALESAIAAIEAGAKIKTTARYYDIPASSLTDHLYGRTLSRKRGPPTILKEDEESALETYMERMQNCGHPLSMEDLRLKVALITQERVTPFRDGIPGDSWVRWFKKRHPDLIMRQSQGLEFARAKGLCAENVASFYNNLEQAYQTHNYPPEHIWNCDESGAQAGRNGGGLVWAKKGSKTVHSLMPNEREWLTVLSCVNASGESIPAFYIFKGKRMRENYIAKCEDGASMAMQPEAWMTTQLFSHWISHFIRALESRGGVSPSNRHLLVVDGHNSHVTLEVVQKAMDVGLDIITLPSHTSHRLQPLDVSIFGPFKRAFKRYRDAWTLRNKGQGATKQVLAHWVSAGLQRALTVSNIQAGFRSTGIWPLNPRAVDKYLTPSEQFVQVDGEAADTGPDSEEEPEDGGNEDHVLDEITGDRIPSSQPSRQHFYVGSDDTLGRATSNLDQDHDGDVVLRPVAGSGDEQGGDPHPDHEVNVAPTPIENFLQLPEVPVNPRRRRTREEPLIDYSKSIMMTSEEYLRIMELKAQRKEDARLESERKKAEVEEKKKPAPQINARRRLRNSNELLMRERVKHSNNSGRQMQSERPANACSGS